MTTYENLSMYIKKLCHPMKEIRERSLQLLLAKLHLGWEMYDELGATRELLEALLAWFQLDQPTLQKEALELFLITVKTKSGTYIVKEFGIKNILTKLNKVKHKIELDAVEMFEDVIDTLKFLNTVESEDNFNIPSLVLSETSSDRVESNNSYYNLGSHRCSSKETSVSNEEIDGSSKSFNGVNVLLFPWVELSTSDLKTLTLIEDSLKLLKSTRRCCRFIRDVFLRDFPVEIFLNRPTIIKTLLAIADRQHGGNPREALEVLLSISCLLRRRITQMFSLDLMTNSNKVPYESSDIGIDAELENLRTDNEDYTVDTKQEDTLVVLKQLPAPIFALDTTHSLLTCMASSVLSDPGSKKEVLEMKELNLCLTLVENLISLLMECVSEIFWSKDHSTRTQRDIAHKSCMVMRTIGDLITRYGQSLSEHGGAAAVRGAWLRLARCGARLARWAGRGAALPAALSAALQRARLDPVLRLLYPALTRTIDAVLSATESSVDQEYKTKYRELTKLFTSMEHAVQFMQKKDSIRLTKDMLISIKNSLPVLQLHQSEAFLKEISDVILQKSKLLNFEEEDWSVARSIALNLMAHESDWVQETFYTAMLEMVKSVLIGDDDKQDDREKRLTLICDVGVLTEICCHGLSSSNEEVERVASDVMLYLLRGRLVLSERCWWRLLASLLPVLPLLHVYAAHDTPLGKAICKSLEPEIVECMGVSTAEMVAGLVRLLFVNCAAVQLDAAHALCALLDDDRYLPPRESIRTDMLMNCLRRLEPQDFNVDADSSPSKPTQTTGLRQMLEVLKQDVTLEGAADAGGEGREGRGSRSALEPSLRRATLQQLALVVRQRGAHSPFLLDDGLRLAVATLRMSLRVDDYLVFPECAISCVSIINSVCFESRHDLAKIPDLPLLLLRTILVFPSNESCVLMCAQVLAAAAWAGFLLLELDAARRRVPALPRSVARRAALPFAANHYWTASPNAQHCSLEWLLSDEMCRTAVRVHWWWVRAGGARALRASPAPPPAGPAPCTPTERELLALRASCVPVSCARALLDLENATSHHQVTEALCLLESYICLVSLSSVSIVEFGSLPWHHTRRYLSAPPASSRDTALLITLLQFIATYMDNVPHEGGSMTWIKSSLIGKDAVIITLLSKEKLFPQQTPQEDIEVTQLRIHIVKILFRCVKHLEHEDDYDSNRMESLLKILLACLESVDLSNFHMLGYLNELIRCVRYVHYSRYCRPSEDTLMYSLRVATGILRGCAGGAGGAAGAGRKGQACRLDAILTLLAILNQIHTAAIPIQRWSEAWSADAVRVVAGSARAERPELRAAAARLLAALARHAQLLPHLAQAVPRESLSQYALELFCEWREAGAVRAAAAALLATLAARTSPHSQVLEREILQELKAWNFLEHCLHIFVEFCNKKECINYLEPNVPPSVLEQGSEMEVRAQKSDAVRLTPRRAPFADAPPTPALVAATADVLHNVSGFKSCPVEAWNEQGLYRVMFRCTFWSSGSAGERDRVRAAACRALAVACARRCVRAALAATKDCLYNLLMTFSPLENGDCDSATLSARTQSLLLLSELLPEREAGDCVWWELMKDHSGSFFHSLLQSLQAEDIELQGAALYCLTQLTLSTAHRKHADKSKDVSCIQFLDNLKSPFCQEQSARFGAGDSSTSDCQPEYMIEEVCNVLVQLYHNLSEEKRHLSSEDERWIALCACLSAVLASSARARRHCSAHRRLPAALLATLSAARDRLSLQGKPVDVIMNANHEPVLVTVYWVLTVSSCLMVECAAAKEQFADDGLAGSLVRLWPWTMLTDQLRHAVVHLLVTYTNDCPKAWASMCQCLGGQCLAGAVCAAAAREAARARPSPLLALSVRVLRHCAPHHHCRAIILKSEALQSAARVRGGGVGERGAARLCAALARHADGAGALLAALPRPPPPRLLPALANAAHHARTPFLQSADLLELLSGTLLTGDTAEVVHAARAVWALAANNHRAKLALRSAGVTSAVQASAQRLARREGVAARRALELLAYTHSVLQST